LCVEILVRDSVLMTSTYLLLSMLMKGLSYVSLVSVLYKVFHDWTYLLDLYELLERCFSD